MIFQILLAITILASSACGLIIEIVAGRLLAPVFGMSLYTWTSIIAVVLAWIIGWPLDWWSFDARPFCQTRPIHQNWLCAFPIITDKPSYFAAS
jgi:hypothetical protein